MRILSVTAQKPNSTGSGVYLTEMVQGLRELGHEQAVLAGVYKEDMVLFPKEVRVYPVYFQTERLPFAIPGMSDEMPYESTVYGEMTAEMLLSFRKVFLEELEQAVSDFKPDVILCHHLYLLTALVREAYPAKRVIGICHGTDIRQMKKNPMCRVYISEQIKKLDFVFALQEQQKQEIIHIYGVEKARIEVIGVGYNHRIFRTTGYEKEAYPKRILFAGKIAEKKGVMSLLRALGKMSLKESELILSLAGGYGNKKEYEEIKELARQCKYTVEFLGVLPQMELARKLEESHLFVLPSFYEGLPLVLMEALACGAAVVCTDLPGVKAWMDTHLEGHGIHFVEPPVMLHTDEPRMDTLDSFEERLAEAMQHILEEPPVDHVRTEHLSWQGVTAQIERYIEQLR